MNTDLATLQRLLATVDDARMCQCRVARDLAHPHVRRVLEHAGQAHLEIGADLADRIVKAGRRPTRRGSVIGSLFAMLAKWTVRFSADIEAFGVMQAANCETRVLRRLRTALENIRDPEMQARLRGHQRQIEHVSLKISQLGFLLQMQSSPSNNRAFARRRVAVPAPAP